MQQFIFESNAREDKQMCGPLWGLKYYNTHLPGLSVRFVALYNIIMIAATEIKNLSPT